MLNINYSPWPCFSDEEVDLVAEVLKSNKVNYWTGTIGKEFEQRFAQYVGTNHAVTIANGTLALEVALRALGVGAGDEVIVPPRTFMATASSVAILGATPVFADIESESQNISAHSIAEKITEKTKAVICVHLAGWPCDMDAINAVCRPQGIKVVEDCAQAHGARYKGLSVGAIGDIAAWSFCQDKIMTTGGEGGMVTTNDQELFRRVWEFKDHGKSYDAVFNRQHPPGFRWLHESIGSNYRMTEMQSALGLYQLDKLDEWVARRRKAAKAYSEVISKFPFVCDYHPDDTIYHAFYRYYAFWEHCEISRDEFIKMCLDEGVPVFQGSCSEVYREKAFQDTLSYPAQRLPNAVVVGEKSLMFLTHPTLTDAEISDLCKRLHTVLCKVEGK